MYWFLYNDQISCCIDSYIMIILCWISSLFHSLRFFHTSVSCRSFTGVCVTAILLRSPGHFTVFWWILTILLSGWCLFFLWFPIPPVFLLQALGDPFKSTNYSCYHRHLPHLFQFSGKVQVFVYLFAFFYFYPVVRQND